MQSFLLKLRNQYLTAYMLVIGIILVLVFILFPACNNNKRDKAENQEESEKTISGDLIIFHAGSLSVPFKKISEEFEKEYPDVKIILESAGSRTCARKITDLNRPCDIMASADYKVIDNLLIPGYADWNIKFASNEISIVYHEESRCANEINKENWFDILLKENVAFGRSDPNSDPCGYRAVLTTKLAEKYYKKPGLAKKLLSKDLNYIRPKEVDLLALLETNTIDYIFIYRSIAEQHHLKYLLLPDEINLKDPGFADFYSTATIDISGKKPGKIITKKGEPLVYGITVLRDAPNEKVAEVFVTFLLTKDKGMAIMEKNGQPSVVPASTDTYEKIPEILKIFAKNNNMVTQID